MKAKFGNALQFDFHEWSFMPDERDFTIDQVSWHTLIQGNPETPAKVYERFRVVATFLQEWGLAKGELLPPGQEITEDFAIRSSDLTAEGLAVMRLAYDKWLRAVANKCKTLSDTRILERAAAKIRGE